MRSNPFLKSAKNDESPRSIASNIMCSKYTKAWWVDFPEIANCLGSRCDVIHGRTLKDSHTVAVCDELNNHTFFPLEHELGTPHAHISLEPVAPPQ